MDSNRPHFPDAFSLVELVFSMAVVALLLLGAISMDQLLDSQKPKVAAERFASCMDQARHRAITRRQEVLLSIRHASSQQIAIGLWETAGSTKPKLIARERDMPPGVDFRSDNLTKQELSVGFETSEAWVMKVDRHGRLSSPEGSGMVRVTFFTKEDRKPRELRVTRNTARVLMF